jgi:DNA repair protein RadC
MEVIILIVAAYFLYRLFSGGKRTAKKRRPPFKKLYVLDHVQPINEFEEKMIKGMLSEKREIFVTAFVNNTHVLRVTATIGSKYRCNGSDNINLWGEKAVKIGATRIRQYHNHPDVFGRSFPSGTDKNTHRQLKPFIEQWGVKYQSLLIYRSWLGGVRIREYN